MDRMKSLRLCLLATLLMSAWTAWSDDIQFRADEYTTNFETKKTRAKGNVVIQIEDRTLKADQVEFDGPTGQMTAIGHVFFTQGRFEIRGEHVELNMRDGLGNFSNAVLKVQDSITIESRFLSRVSPSRYRAEYGKITSCQDCPQSWSLVGSSLDVEVEGFAEIHHALFQIKDDPWVYFPIFYFPVKTKRQSGFLIPQVKYSNELGSQVALPYFHVLSSHSDATYEYRYMTAGGNRLGAEYRGVYSDRSFLNLHAGILQNGSVANVPDTRMGYSVDQRQQLTKHLTERFRGEWARDTRYSANFPNEYQSTLLPTLINEPSLSWQNERFFVSGVARVENDNLPRSTSVLKSQNIKGPIHTLPELTVSLPTESFWGPFRAGADFKTTSFRRKGGSVDPGTNWIRTGDRATLETDIRAAEHFFGLFLWDPSIRTRSDVYNFQAQNSPGAAYRGRVIFDQKISAESSRVFAADFGDVKAFRHTMTPYLRHSFAPPDAKTLHPFFETSNAPRFDLFDPNSPDVAQIQLGSVSEEQRLHQHHLVTFGLSSRLIARSGTYVRSYADVLSVRVERDYNLLTQDFGRILISGGGAWAGFSANTSISLDPKTSTSDMRNEVAYGSSHFDFSGFQTVSPTAEAYGLGTAIKAIGAWTVAAKLSFDAKVNRFYEQSYTTLFNSDSKCWYFSFVASRGPLDHDFDYKPMIGLVFNEGQKAPF